MSEITTEAIPNQYIVVFKQDTPEDKCKEHCEWAQSRHTEAAELTGIGEQFSLGTVAGYVATIDENLKNEIEARGEVDYVEPDYVVHAINNGVQKPVPSWGLVRMSSNKTLPNPLPRDLEYTYDATSYAYIIDTGILIAHEDFGGRAKLGTNTVPGSPNKDKNGHGTHVAGIVGGAKYGMAKRCDLIAVKVLGDNGKGATSGVIKGVEWAVNDAKNHNWINKSAANMSLGGPLSKPLNAAVAAAVRAGMTMVVAAGNGNKDAKDFSPASEPSAITVGSIDVTDKMSSFSNWGQSVNLFAPGRNITSAWIQPGNKGINTISGTSMAAPHITGLALCLVAQNPDQYPNPAAVLKAIRDLAEKNSRVVPPVPPETTDLIGFNGP